MASLCQHSGELKLQQKIKTDDNVPLCVDLDGTLILTDMLAESLVRALRRAPWLLFLIPYWLFRGKPYLKARLAERSDIAFERLPYNIAFIAFLKREKERGRRLILVTGSHEKVVRPIAEHLGLFSEVMATSDHYNMVGRSKAAHLIEQFGVKQFDYAGNEKADFHIWRQARKSILVNASTSVERKAEQDTQIEIEHRFQPAPFSLKSIIKAMRVHQWTKNTLIFAPILLAHQLFSLHAWLYSLLGFASFCFMASSTYIVNDLCDLDADRKHPTKCERPFASGKLTLPQGVGLMLLLAVFALLPLPLLPWEFSILFLLYLLGTLTYTFFLKSLAIVDVLILATLFTIRVVAGGAAIQVEPSFWLMSFSIFIFLSLAIVKRVSELINLRLTNQDKAAGRGYQVEDIPILKAMGVCSSFLAVLVFALYINSPDVAKLYGEPRLLWFICPGLLYWVSEIWLITARGGMNEDPIIYALKDLKSWVVGAVVVLVYLAAIVVG